MIITCPNCKTTYNLADDRVKIGAKLRCTVCKQVFPLLDPSEVTPKAVHASGDVDSNDDLHIRIGGTPPKKPKKSTRTNTIAMIVLALAIGASVYAWNFTPWLDPIKNKLGKPEVAQISEVERAAKLAEMVSQLEMRGLRQYTVPNEKLGKITVIEGKVANGFDQPRELIRLEASLFNDKGEILMSKSQLAGTMVSLFQLQVLDKDELERALSNKLDILSNNTNVPPGALVPFMIVLYNTPTDATDFSIKVIDARLPEVKAMP